MNPAHSQIADYVAKAFGAGKAVTKTHRHEEQKVAVDIMCVEECPDEGITSASTIGLSDAVMREEDGEEFPVRLELCAAFPTSAPEFPSILAQLSYLVKKTGQLLAPGTLVENAISELFPDATVPHAYLTTPFPWGEDNLESLTVMGKTIAWLCVIPVSEKERIFLEEKGDEALEDALEDGEVDIYDLERESSV